MTFDENQRAVIEAGSGPMLVTAGPGSGKTAVLTHRIRYLNETFKIPYNRILVITFTKAAAKQMKERFEILNNGDSKVTFCTFHALFYSIIRDSDNSQFSIITQNEKLNIVKTVLLDENIDVTRIDLNALLDEFSKLKNLDKEVEGFDSHLLDKNEFIRVYNSYTEECRERKLMDYDDFVYMVSELFDKDEAFYLKWKDKYEYCLIDEFQDINYKQYSVIKKLFMGKNVFAVGDEDQSIYAFRGSSSDICIRFKKDFDADVLKLVTNYRCSKSIVESAMKLITNNTLRFDKEIVPANDASIGESKVKIYQSSMDEYNELASEINECAKTGKSIAILFRTNNIPDSFVFSMIKNKVKYKAESSFSSRKNGECTQDILTYMRMASGELTYDNLMRIANKPNRYVSRNYLAKCMEEEKDKSGRFSYKNIYKNCKGKQYLAANIFKLEKNLREIGKMDAFESLMYIVKVVGYDRYINEKNLKFDTEFEELKSLCREFGSKEELTDYFEMVIAENMLTNDNENNETNQSQTDEKTSEVEICTIHSSKGREWDYVFIPDVNEGTIPHKKAETLEETEEERRLFYVAMTRAKEKLWIGSVKDIQKNAYPSLFARELTR